MPPRRSTRLVWLHSNRHPTPAVEEPAGPNHEPALGAHLVTSRCGYTHHGIYVGGGMVVHYAGLSRLLHSGPVEEVTVSQFSMGRPLRIVGHPESLFSPTEIVRRARSRLGEKQYHVLKNNCEHFCSWCTSGRSRSFQVERPEAIALRAFVAAAQCAGWLPHMLGALRTILCHPAGVES